LKSDEREITGCWADRITAKALAGCLFEPVRLFGVGRWNRDDDGRWSVDIFRIRSFKKLRDVPLSVALAELRAISTEWSHDSYDELGEIREDRAEAANGGV
jgi:hypothetical protein